MSNQKLNKQLRKEVVRKANEKAVAHGTTVNPKALAKRCKAGAIAVGKVEKKAKSDMAKRTSLGYTGNDLLERKRINTHWSGAKVNTGDFYKPDRRTKTVTAR